MLSGFFLLVGPASFVKGRILVEAIPAGSVETGDKSSVSSSLRVHEN